MASNKARDWRTQHHKNIKSGPDGAKKIVGGTSITINKVKKGTSTTYDKYGVSGTWKNK